MARITSAIGSKNYQSGMREFVVDDADDAGDEHYHQPPQFNQEVDYREHFKQRNEKLSTKEKLSDSAKKRIEILCGMTQLVKEVEIENTQFVIKSLKNKENRQSIANAMKYDGTIEFPFEIRKQILARSIHSISGVDVESFLGDSSLQSRLDFIDELDDGVAERLYQEYLNLAKEIKEKYSLKTEDSIKELVDDLKK